MKVLQINIFGNLSTGRIAVDIYRTLVANGHEGKVAFARNTIAEDVPYIKIGNTKNVYIDGILTRITDRAGFFSKRATRRLIEEIEGYDPDIIHLHNLHGYYINIEILFKYLKKCGKPVVWTLHDCWAFTGHCCYYSAVECDKWINGCHDCPQKKAYPSSLFIDNSEWNYKRKKELFTSLLNLHLVTVSKWLKSELKKSFLKDLPCTTVYNGIDVSVFKPTISEFREKYALKDKSIILGVASTWDVRKGLDDFIKLSSMIDENYRIVVVGVNESEIKRLSPNMIGISRTDSVYELAGIYTAADIFFNASVEETFGLPTVEAMACGTPAIVYDATALPEIIFNEDIGVVVEKGNVEKVAKIIKRGLKRLTEESRLEIIERYNKNHRFLEYINLYSSILDNQNF